MRRSRVAYRGAKSGRRRRGLRPVTTSRHAVTAPTSSKSSGVYRQPGLPPGVEPAVERVNILPALLKQLERHTGARSFVRSGAVGDDRAAERYLFEVLLDLVRGHADR